MPFALGYLAQRFVFRATDFFHHWYVDGSRAALRALLRALARADRRFAVAITLRHFFAPLYGDYSAVGRILGLVFRTFRILIGLAVYTAIAMAFLVAFVVWLAVPLMIPFVVMRNLSALVP